MTIWNLVIGCLLIGTGFLVKAYPDLIAGYNSLSKAEKAKIDIDGLSTFLRNGLILTGFIQIAGVYILNALNLVRFSGMITTLIITIMLVFLVIRIQKFDLRGRK